MRTLIVRLALAGLAAGAICGAADFALVAGKVSPFLPTGPLRLLGFLVGLYGLAGALLGALLAIVAAALDRGDVGGTIRDDRKDGARVTAYALGGGLSLGVAALTARVVVEPALTIFHNRPLIGALSGAASAGAALGAMLVMVMAAPLVSRALPFGPRVTRSLRGSRLAAIPAIIVAFYAGAGFIAVHVLFLAGRARMNHTGRAINAEIGAPIAIGLGALIGWASYRWLRRREAGRPTAFAVLLASTATLLGPPIVAAAVTWQTTRQLDLRPFVTGTAIVLGALFLRGALKRNHGLALLLLMPLCAALTFGLGRIARVRKATTLVGLAPHIVRGVQLVTDLDHDGYSSVLGGGDCDDLDRRVHPGAFDWPDDGIDQDCNGHEATLAERKIGSYAAVPEAVPQTPNVLLITIDALRADHVSSYGYDRRTTPNLDELAKDGVRFENAWAHAPSTRYSVPAILIGRYPSTIAVNNDSRVHWPPQVLPENRLISEMLKEAGYRTGATLSYHYFEPGWGLNQGFDDYDHHLYTLHSVGGDPAATSGSSARQLADLDVEWLKKHAGERWFLWTHFYDTHYRFERHPDLPESDFGGDEPALYDGEIRYCDHHIGRVFAALKELGLWDKTIIVVTADHGDGFGEHGIPIARRHGYHLYRTETKVPVLIRAPGIPPRIVDTPIGHVDLIPTIRNLLRMRAEDEPQLLGDSQVAAMLGAEPHEDDRAIYQEVWFEGPTALKGLVTRGWHLIRNLVPSDTTELYDLGKDPAEEHDLAGLGETVERDLLARLGGISDALAIPPRFAETMKDAIGKTARTPQRPLGDIVGDYLVVSGADVDHPKIAAGESATVTVHLDIKRAIPDGWILFTHAVGAMGRAMNLDHAPIESLVPLQTLEPGQFVRDPIRVSIPAGWPPGPVRLELGLYKKGTRAPARGSHSSGDAVQIPAFEVVSAR